MAFRITRKKIIIIVIVLGVAAAGVGVFIYKDMLFGTTVDNTAKIKLPALVDKNIDLKNTQAVTVAANKLNDSGASAQDVLTVYDAAIQANTDPEINVVYYISKSSVLINEKQYENALLVAMDAEKLSPNKYTAAQLAEIYVLLGDTVSAVKYYKIAIERAGDVDDKSNYVTEYYQKRIEELQ